MIECHACRELKPVSEYNKNAKGRDGLSIRCRDCDKKRRYGSLSVETTHDRNLYREIMTRMNACYSI